MPNIPQQQTIVQYITNSAQLTYTFAFYAPLPTDIQVYYQASTATPIPASDILALNSQYTVTYNADPITGGFITLLFTPTTGFYLTINRQVGASLNTSFSNAQNFSGANLDAALDRLLLLCQQNQNYALERNLSYVINTYLPNAVPFTQLPPLEQNQVWIGSGAGVIAATIDIVPSASVLQSMLESQIPGADGARIVGYYDTTNSFPTTVDQFLAYKVASAADSSVVANIIAVTLATNYVFLNGNTLIARIGASNTGATTIAVNGGTAIAVNKYGNLGTYAALVGGELTGGGLYTFTYDLGHNIWLLVDPNAIANNYFYGASVYASGTQVVPTGGGGSIIQFDTVDYDNFGIFAPTTHAIRPFRPGYYTITGIVQAVGGMVGSAAINLFKNGALWVSLDESALGLTQITMGGTFTLFLNGTTDFVQLVFVNSTGGNVNLVSSGFFNNFQVTYNGA
jgi:hypothetical protein